VQRSLSPRLLASHYSSIQPIHPPQARFPAELAAGKDIEKTASAVCRHYMDGICWVYRYYSLGPAAIQWLPDGSPVTSDTSAKSDEPEGASWTWFFPYHYAPLMQVLGACD